MWLQKNTKRSSFWSHEFLLSHDRHKGNGILHSWKNNASLLFPQSKEKSYKWIKYEILCFYFWRCVYEEQNGTGVRTTMS